MEKIKEKIIRNFGDALYEVMNKDYGYIVPVEDMPQTFFVRAAIDGATEAIILTFRHHIRIYHLGVSTYSDCKDLGVSILGRLLDIFYEDFKFMVALFAEELYSRGDWKIEIADDIYLNIKDKKVSIDSKEEQICFHYNGSDCPIKKEWDMYDINNE